MRSVLIFGLFIMSTQALADVKDEIFDMAERVKNRIYQSEASDESLNEALDDLREAMKKITSSGNTQDPACYEFAYAKHYANNNSSDSASMARQNCRVIVDLEVAKFLWSKHYSNNNSSASMSMATEQSGAGMRNKLEILQFSWSKYYSNNNSSTSATMAASGSATVSTSSISCLKSAWSAHYSNNNSSKAMDLAFGDCR